MNNKIYELTDNFDFTVVKLENPTLISGNNYYSKINNTMKTNLYIQLPKCNTKQGIINTNNKCLCDLEFFSNNKQVIEFFENLESHCVQEICSNKELWFYDPTNISDDDIQEYMVPIMRSYKSGKKFLIKTSVKQDKIIIYDENEKKITLEEYDKVNEIVPLININGIKFSKSSFIIDIILVQFMILYPCDTFENQILIKVNKPINKIPDKDNNKITVSALNSIHRPNKDNSDYNYDDTSSVNDDDDSSLNDDETLINANDETLISANDETLISTNDETLISANTDNTFSTIKENNITQETIVEGTITQNKNPMSIEIKEVIESNALESNPVIEICDLDNIISNNEPIEIKTHDTIYLEIYKKAKQKAKEIRKNAILAFLEAKNIKVKYNLNTLDDSSSDEECKF